MHGSAFIAISRTTVPGLARTAAVVTAGLGLGLVGLAVVVPWITVFRGLEAIPGFVLEGGPLAGLVVGGLGLLMVAATLGGGRVLRSIALVAAVLVVADATLAQLRILDYVANPGPAGPLTQPTAGIGAGLMAIGAGLILLAIVVLPIQDRRLEPAAVLRLLMSAALFLAGWIHLLLVPEHLDESPILGIGFLASGLAQLALVAVVVWRPRDWNLALVVAINVTLIGVYAYAILVGLPFAGTSEHVAAVGLVVGAGEPIDTLGAVSKVAELLSLAIAFGLLGRSSRAIGVQPGPTAHSRG
jgi:hypothetical protein